jgi:hypothetical protein
MSTPIATDQAWRTFDGWKSTRREIGVIFFAISGTSIYTMGFVESARNGGLLLRSETVSVSFNLKRANFSYGPIQTWPRWPAPPIVEMMALQAQLSNGDWLVLAEGLQPRLLPQSAPPE